MPHRAVSVATPTAARSKTAHAAPPPPGPGPDEFDEALAEAKRAVGALARFADDSRATSARAELLNALTGFGI